LAVEHARTRGARYVVVDADGNDCLRSVAHAWQRPATDWLVVGSAGLARQVAAVAKHRPLQVATIARERGPGARREPVLVVAGSPAPATQAQIEQLRGLGPIVLIDGEQPVPRRPAGNNEVIVLCTRPALERDSGERAQAVAEVTAAWVPGFRPGALVLAGGTTARLVCERLGVRGVRLQGELEPGIPFGHLVGGIWAGLPVVTKAGGFGQNEALLDVVHALGVSSIAERFHD
jgi:uncharacterized protein YgbK (DUF1537 family)